LITTHQNNLKIYKKIIIWTAFLYPLIAKPQSCSASGKMVFWSSGWHHMDTISLSPGPLSLSKKEGPPGAGTMLQYIVGYLSVPWPLLGCCPSLIALRQHIEGKGQALELFKNQEIILLWGSSLFKGLF